MVLRKIDLENGHVTNGSRVMASRYFHIVALFTDTIAIAILLNSGAIIVSTNLETIFKSNFQVVYVCHWLMTKLVGKGVLHKIGEVSMVNIFLFSTSVFCTTGGGGRRWTAEPSPALTPHLYRVLQCTGQVSCGALQSNKLLSSSVYNDL